MNFILGIVIIFFSVLGIVYPEGALRWEDMFRIRGERQYSDFAIAMTRFGGVIGVILGILILFERIL